jgi:hypothetical protein
LSATDSSPWIRHLSIPIGENQQAVGTVDPPTDELDQVDRGIVGPMDVLDDHHRGP